MRLSVELLMPPILSTPRGRPKHWAPAGGVLGLCCRPCLQTARRNGKGILADQKTLDRIAECGQMGKYVGDFDVDIGVIECVNRDLAIEFVVNLAD